MRRDRPFDAALVKTILVFRYDRIGDMVVTTPFLYELKRLFPHSSIDVLSSAGNRGVLRGNPSIRYAPVWNPSVKGILWLWRVRRDYDLVFDLNHSVIWADLLLIRMIDPIWAASVFKVGRYGIPGSKLLIYRLMPSADCSWTRTISGRYLSLIEYLGGKPSRDYRYHLYFDSRQARVPASTPLTPSVGTNKWVVNQHGGRRKMALRDADMRTLIETILCHDPHSTVIWATAPHTYLEVEAKRRSWFQGRSNIETYKPTDNALDICLLLSQSKGLVSPDTSLVHMAAAFNLPVVIVFANERALFEQWKPPIKIWQRHVFSVCPKSLQGYSRKEFIRAVEELLLNGGCSRSTSQIRMPGSPVPPTDKNT